MRRLVLLLLVAGVGVGFAASAGAVSGSTGSVAACGGPDEPLCGLPPEEDSDGDGVRNQDDPCPLDPAENGGKLGCSPFRWFGNSGNLGANLNDVVNAGYVEVTSYCRPGVCKAEVTLTAAKRARKMLGLKKALLGRQTKTQKTGRFGVVEASFFEFDLPRKVVRKMDGLDRLELQVKVAVTAHDSSQMEAQKFTESGTIRFDRRRPRKSGFLRGQGMYLFRGDKPPNCGVPCGD
jgi:hypothetical protein